MHTLKRSWLTLSRYSFLFVLLAMNAHAFQTPSGLVVSYQPWKLAREAPFRSEGTLRFADFSANYVLSWVSPGTYELVVSGLPKTLYSNEAVASDEWKISRRQGKCVIKTGTQVSSCGGPGLWAAIELSGRAETVVESLLQNGIISPEMAADPVIDSKDPSTLKIDPRQKISLGKSYGLPTAFIELRGSSLSRDSQENLYPLIQYDQTFLAPRLLRVKSGDDIFSLEANGEMDLDKENPRNSYMLSDKLVLKNQKDQQLTISRKTPGPLPTKFQLVQEKTLYDLNILSNALTFDGQFILNALLFTH